MYTYYVASFDRWTLVEATNAKLAINLAELTDELRGKPILTARIAAKHEIEQHRDHLNSLAEERQIDRARFNRNLGSYGVDPETGVAKNKI